MSRHIINSRARAEAVGFCKIEHIRFEKCVFSVSQILSADLPNFDFTPISSIFSPNFCDKITGAGDRISLAGGRGACWLGWGLHAKQVNCRSEGSRGHLHVRLAGSLALISRRRKFSA